MGGAIPVASFSTRGDFLSQKTGLGETLSAIESGLQGSIDVLGEIEQFRGNLSANLGKLLKVFQPRSNAYLLVNALDTLHCLIEAELQECHRLRVSGEKAIRFLQSGNTGDELIRRLNVLGGVDAAIQDGAYSRHTPGYIPNYARFRIDDVLEIHSSTKEGWEYWTSNVHRQINVVRSCMDFFVANHPFSPVLGTLFYMLSSLFEWCEQQRKIEVAISVLSAPSNKYSGKDYSSFLRLELFELKRRALNSNLGEEE